MKILASIVPDDACLFDVAQSAAGSHLHLLSNGRRAVLSPVLLKGWTRVDVRSKAAGQAIPPRLKETNHV